MDNSCSCRQCVSGCTRRPGWFHPGEVAKAAEYLGMTPKEFFDKYLVVDYQTENRHILLPGEDEPGQSFVFVLSPALAGMKTGTEAPFDMMGRCVFFTDDQKCAIHPAKPGECRHAYHDHTDEQTGRFKLQMVEEWRGNEQEVTDLLGREPKPMPPNPFEAMRFMLKTEMEMVRKMMGRPDGE